jgi:hypothetical protein
VGIPFNLAGNDSQIEKYTPSANPATNADYVSSLSVSGSAFPVCNLAADGEGGVYIDKQPSGPVVKYEAQFGGSTELDSLVDEHGSTIAVNPSNNDLYVDEGEEVSQYDSDGKLLGHTAGIGGSFGIAVSGASGNVYVSDNAKGRVDVFGPDLVVPDVVARPASAVTTTGATLNGTVNPDGLAVRECEFEYGLDSSYGHRMPCAGDAGQREHNRTRRGQLLSLPPRSSQRQRDERERRRGAAQLFASSRRTLPECSGPL